MAGEVLNEPGKKILSTLERSAGIVVSRLLGIDESRISVSVRIDGRPRDERTRDLLKVLARHFRHEDFFREFHPRRSAECMTALEELEDLYFQEVSK